MLQYLENMQNKIRDLKKIQQKQPTTYDQLHILKYP